MSRKISSSAEISRFAIINLPTSGDLPLITFDSQQVANHRFMMTFYLIYIYWLLTHQCHRAHSCHGRLSWVPASPPVVSSCCPQPLFLCFSSQRVITSLFPRDYHLVTQRLCSLTPWPTDIPAQTQKWRHKVGCYSRMKHATFTLLLYLYRLQDNVSFFCSLITSSRELRETRNKKLTYLLCSLWLMHCTYWC